MGLLTRLRGPKAKREAPVEDAPLFLITGRPRSATEPRPFQRFPDEYRNTAPSQRADRPAPALTIPSSASAVSHNDVATPHDAASSTHSPSRLGDSSGWQGQPKRPSCELYDDGGLAEEIEDSPQREQFTPPLQDEWRVAADSMPVDPSSSPPPPSSFPARRLLRRASGKLKDLKMLRPVSRGATERSDYPTPGSSAGQSLGAYSTISLFNAHSTSDLALPSTSPGKEGVALSLPRRARALSSSSAKDVVGLFPTTAPFSRALGRSVAADPLSDSPPTPLLDGQTTPASNDSPHAPSSRWKKTPGRSERPSTALGVPSMSCATYLSHISPPPKGLPAHDLAGRKGLVCHIVQTRTLEESRTKSKRKGALQVTLKGLPPSSTPSSHTTETVMSRFEDEVHQFMQEDILRGTDAQRYQDLHLTDVFIEARRALGMDSSSMRLHSMFDLVEVEQLLLVNRRGMPRAPSPLSPPPSAWSTVRLPEAAPSLSPAPRKKRRPKTAPIHRIESNGHFQPVGDTSREPSFDLDSLSAPAKDTSFLSLAESRINHISDAHYRNAGSADEASRAAEEAQIQVLTPALFSSRPTVPSPRKSAPSLPPSPPRSSESHNDPMTVEVSKHGLPPLPLRFSSRSHSRFAVQPRWSSESQTLTNSSCEAAEPWPPLAELHPAATKLNHGMAFAPQD